MIKSIDAPLCRRCAKLLRQPPIRVYKISGIAEAHSECPWCNRNQPEAIYTIEIISK